MNKFVHKSRYGRSSPLFRIFLIFIFLILTSALLYEGSVIREREQAAPQPQVLNDPEKPDVGVKENYYRFSPDGDAPKSKITPLFDFFMGLSIVDYFNRFSTFKRPTCEEMPILSNCTKASEDYSFAPVSVSRDRGPTSLRILQFGDSHTASDFFTGEVRRELQEKFGNGGLGLLPAGRPYKSYRSDLVENNATASWVYSELTDKKNKVPLPLTGYLAETQGANQSLTFAFKTSIQNSPIEILIRTRSTTDVVEAVINNDVRQLIQLNGEQNAFYYVALEPYPGAIKRLELQTHAAEHVAIGGILSVHPKSGISLSALGFPGATMLIMKRYQNDIFREELLKLAPQIIIFSFGTNEGFDDELKAGNYKADYASMLEFVQEVLPDSQLIIILPPEGARRNAKIIPAKKDNCEFSTPTNLPIVRDIQAQLALEKAIPAWDWSALMPKGCDLDQWISGPQKLMAPDHVHLTRDGYQFVARDFTQFLLPYVERRLVNRNAVPNN